MIAIRTPEETRAALENQLRALDTSCNNFDAGQRWEAIRLAAATFVLVHDGGRKNQSIVTMLGLKRQILFTASGAKITEKDLFSQQLVAVSWDSERKGVFNPLLDSASEQHRLLRFGEWWERDAIFKNGDLTMTRRRLVYALRNQEGGAHFGRIDDPNYEKYARNPAWEFQPVGGERHKIYGIEAASMRQIAWELISSLRNPTYQPVAKVSGSG